MGEKLLNGKKKLNLSLKLITKENNSLPIHVLAVRFKFCIGSLVGPGMKTDPKRDENTIAFIPSDKCEGLHLLAKFRGEKLYFLLTYRKDKFYVKRQRKASEIGAGERAHWLKTLQLFERTQV